MQEASLEACHQYLTVRNTKLEVPTRPSEHINGEPVEIFFQRQKYLEPTVDNARSLLEITSKLDSKRVAQFLTHRYVYNYLPKFMERNPDGSMVIDPKKIDLTLEVADKLDTLGNIYNYEPQYMGALSVVGFAATEYLQDHGVTGTNSEDIIRRLTALHTEEIARTAQTRKEKQKMGRGDIHIWGKTSITRHALRYAEAYDPTRDGVFENYVLKSLTADVYKRLQKWTEETAFLKQPQGFEVEVLKQVTQSRRAIERGSERWLPRGLPTDKHERKDWPLIELLGGGLHEDIGERRYQLFEVTSDPSEGSSPQTTALFALASAGFFTEKELSPIFEGYSLHVSTIFPKEILTKASMTEYHRMARSLAGAFASSQRIGFGGFLSGGTEVTDKTTSGTLREVVKIKDVDPLAKSKIPEGYALVEVRNLDLTPGSHITALHAKPYLDFGFKAYWKQQSGSSELTGLERESAKVWREYMTEVSGQFEKYNISDDPASAWNELAKANETDASFRTTLQRINRQTVSKLRLLAQEQKSPERINQLINKPHMLLTEPLGQQDDRIYLPETYRTKLGIAPGDTITLSVNGKKKEVLVAQAKRRGNDEVDELPRWRLSENIISELNLPHVSPVNATFDRTKRVLEMITNDTLDKSVHLDCMPKKVISEPLGQYDDRIYLNAEVRKQFGLQPGDEIEMRFGQVKRRVQIAQAKNRPETGHPEDATSENFRVSANILNEFGIPDTIALRSRFDSSQHELAFGPIIGVLNTDKKPEQTLFGKRTKMIRSLQVAANDIGGLVVVINPHDPANKELKDGFVTGYIDNGKGEFQKVTMPFPDVIYDKDVSWLAATKPERFEAKLRTALGRQPDLRYVFPPEMQAMTLNKDAFNAVVGQNEYLRHFLPDSQELTSKAVLENFLSHHDSIFLKPKGGQQGQGLMRVTKLNNGEYTYEYPYKTGDVWEIQRGTTQSIDKLYATLLNQQKGKSTFLMQTYLDIAEIEIDTPRDKEPRGLRSIELRTLVQRGPDRRTGVTGVVARMTDKKLTGHEYEIGGLNALLQAFSPEEAEEIYIQAKRLAVAATKAVEQHLEAPVGEITIDIAVTKTGELYILEGNSKAETRGMFDRIDNRDAMLASMTNPVQYATSIAGFN